MPTSPATRTAGSAPVATSHCEVCNVVREPGGVVIHFGQRGPAALDPQATGVTLRHRVAFDEGTAARLQDLMTALLNESQGSRDALR